MLARGGRVARGDLRDTKVRLLNGRLMTDKIADTDFDYNLRHVGSHAEFYGDSEPRISKEEYDKYSKSFDKARVFYRRKDDEALSAAQLLEIFLKTSNTVLRDYVPNEIANKAIETGERQIVPVVFPIDFAPNAFYMKTAEGGKADVKRLQLFVEFTLEPRRQS